MEVQTQPSLSFKGVDIIDVKFESIRPFSTEEEVSINIDAKIVKEEELNFFKIFMHAHLESDNFFTLDVEALGNFKINNIEDKSQALDLLNVNAPAIMFPYLRAFITSFTANCGDSISTIVLPPQFFSGNLDTLEH